MKKGLLCIFLSLLLAATLISASSYSAEFTQVGSNVVVKETLNGASLKSYVDSGLIHRSGSMLYFVKRINFSENFDQAEIRLVLDKGIILSDNLAFPEGYSVDSDGQSIFLVWDLKDVKAGQDFAMFITLEDTTTSLSWIYWVIGIAVLIAIGYIVYRSKNKKNKSKATKKTKLKKEKSNVYDYLLDTEKRVIEELKKADRNELWQKQIQNSTGYSKAKVSRLIRNLEARNLVVKIPFGNTNKVRLK